MKVSGSPELVVAHQQLAALVKRTRRYIGGVASRGYKELNKLPAAEHHPMDLPTSGMYGDYRFFKGRRIVRAAALLGGPVRIGDSDSRIAETSTETYQRRHYNRYGESALRLPVSNRLVTVDIETPASRRTFLSLPSTVSISTHGYATFERRTDETEPRIASGDLTGGSFGYRGYKTAEELQVDYVHKYSSALAVTSVIAASLSLAHGIEADPTPGMRILLVEEWQNASPEGARALDPGMAAFLSPRAIEP